MRFKLRTLMLLVLACSTFIGLYSHRALRQKRIVGQLISQGGSAYYSVQDVKPFPKLTAVTKSDFWNHFRFSTKMIILQPSVAEPADEQLELVSQLPRLDYLYIWPGGARNNENRPARRIAAGGMTDKGADFVINRLNHLQHFMTTSSLCSDEKLIELEMALANAEILAVLPHSNSNTKPFIRK